MTNQLFFSLILQNHKNLRFYAPFDFMLIAKHYPFSTKIM